MNDNFASLSSDYLFQTGEESEILSKFVNMSLPEYYAWDTQTRIP